MKNTRWMLGAVLTVLTAFAGIVSTQPGLAAKAADEPASAQIKIDNFTFGPHKSDRRFRNDRYLDKQR